MRVLVIGSGGREHALAWSMKRAGHDVLCAPGNPGMERDVDTLPIPDPVLDPGAVVALAEERHVDLVVVGPEAPLVAGLADRLRASGRAVFGPGERGARLEGSKRFAKEFFARHGIPTARFRVCSRVDDVRDAVAELGENVVVKADGLAAGKGVVVCSEPGQALAVARDMLSGRFGDAGNELVVEERLAGREVSVMAITDGRRTQVLATAEDHKAIFDGDQGPNTGGMGAVSPAPTVDDELMEVIRRDVFDRTMAGLERDGVDFRGVLYAGLMVTERGPMMLEYNVRFGDPETQAVLARLRSDLGEVLASAARGQLVDGDLDWDGRASAAVVMASRGYPGAPDDGKLIRGIDDVGDAIVFCAGVGADGERLISRGGRVLSVVALGSDVCAARARAYAAVERIHFDGAHYRTDIGARVGAH